ncbi:hypothetical protein RCO27_00580 [Sphingosinicella sp. LHD-64]|uniref:hypothetical protein n=1 Tax=Sphingosinicella sp. LHD-64 TaxID=3072139 RepID=UPI00280FAB0B|nr:hypothetical protein [Sphingosinicella sp. LHD-64]MDQ8754713.1 hypothetical protein [Sphingosinicella sp. LHD-64]
MKTMMILSGAATLALVAFGGATAQTRQGGTVDYWMSAETTSGFAAQAAQARGGAGMLGAMMSGRGGGDADYARRLTLQLGSPRAASGPPAAEHLPPAALGAGASLPLVSPEAAQRPPQNTPERWTWGDGGAQGRILIYWGCGERARAGQPVEIDLSQIARGQVPPAMAQMVWRAMNPPAAGATTTYGEWPNRRSQTTVPATGSLVGDHVVRGNYTPELRFTLAQGQDFLAPIELTQNSPTASGAVPLAWRSVPNAGGYLLMAVGSREDGTLVMWSSSEVQMSQVAGADYLSEAEVARLVQQRVLLNAQTTQCTVPAEVMNGIQAASLMMTAFGPEANFSYPARPARAPRGWAPEWTVKLRTRSAYMGMLGMDMAAMMRGEDSSSSRSARGRQEQPRRRRSIGGILRDSILGR